MANMMTDIAMGDPNVPKSKVLYMDNTVNLDAVDFPYVASCTNAKELRKVLTALEEDGYFTELIRAAKDKLRELDPKMAMPDWDAKIPNDDLEEAKADLLFWNSKIAKKDSELKSGGGLRSKSMFEDDKTNKPGGPTLPPVRGSRKISELKTEGSLKAKKSTEKGPVDKYAKFPQVQREAMAVREKDKGNECYKAKEFKEAVEFYSKAFEMDPSSCVYLTNRAMANLKLKNWDLAEKDCTQAIEIDPKNAKAWWRRGQARDGKILYEQAISDFDEALKLDPKNVALKKAKSDTQKKMYKTDPTSKPKEAFKRMTIAEGSDDEDDDDSDSGEEVEVPIRRSGKKEATVVEATEVKEEKEQKQANWKRMTIQDDDEEDDDDEDYEDVPINISKKAAAPAQQSKKAAAPAQQPKKAASPTQQPKKPEDKLFDMATQGAEDLAALAEAEQSAGRFSKAIKLYQDAGKALPTPPLDMKIPWMFGGFAAKYHSNIGLCNTQKGDYEQAVQSCSRAVAMAKESKSYDVLVTALLRRGVAYESLGQVTKATNDMEAILALEPKNAKAKEAVARLKSSGKATSPKTGTVDLDAQMEQHKNAGNKHFAAKKFPEAAAAYSAGLAVFEQNLANLSNETAKTAAVNLRNNRAFVYIKMTPPQFQDAVNDCSKVLQVDNSNAKAFFRRGLGYKGLNKWTDALSDFERAYKLLKTANVAAELKTAREMVKTLQEKVFQDNQDTQKQAAQQAEIDARAQETNRRAQEAKFARDREAADKRKAEKAKTEAAAKKTDDSHISRKDWKGPIIEVISSDEEEDDDDDYEEVPINISKKAASPAAKPVPKAASPKKVQSPKKAASPKPQPTKASPIPTKAASPKPEQKKAESPKPETPSTKPSSKTPPSKPVAARASPSFVYSPEAFPVPTSHIAFHRAWTKLNKDPNQFYHYFKAIPADKLSKLFQTSDSLRSEHLDSILLAVKETLSSGDVDGSMAVLSALPSTGRFGLHVMMMSPATTKVVKSIFDYLRSSSTDSATVEQLAKQYR